MCWYILCECKREIIYSALSNYYFLVFCFIMFLVFWFIYVFSFIVYLSICSLFSRNLVSEKQISLEIPFCERVVYFVVN